MNHFTSNRIFLPEWKRTTLVAATAVLALSACGGGGGGGTAFVPMLAPVAGAATTAPATPSTQTPANGDATLVLSVPTPTYAANSEELAALTLLNAERLRCGFGLLAQNALLDTAARGQANYMLKNNVSSHYQDPAKPGFTGATPVDRVVAAGYAWSVVLDDFTDTVGPGANNIAGRGTAAVRGLLSAPYHALSLLDFERDIGIAILGSDAAATTLQYGPRAIAQFNIALAQGAVAPKPDSATVQTYPCDGTTGTAYQLANETPNPVPGRNLAAQPVGQPILVTVRPDRKLAIGSATVVAKLTGQAVALLPVLTHDSDTNQFVDPNQAAILPAGPLQPNTDYIVTVSGTSTATTASSGAAGSNAGVNFTKTFTFRTGAGLP